MRALLSIRFLVAVALLGLAASLATPAAAEPQSQEPMLTIFAIGFVDVAGGDDPDCPGCNGEFDPEDETFAQNNPLGTLDFEVEDDSGTVIASASTEPLATLERAMIDVPDLADGESYTLKLVGIPDGWELCPNFSAERTLTLDDFQLGSTRQDFYFNQGCEPSGDPTATTQPGQPTATTAPGQPTPTTGPRPTDDPDDPDDDDDDRDRDDDDDDDDGDDDRPSSSVTGGGKGPNQLNGVVFIDDNCNGTLQAGETVVPNVQIDVSGGGSRFTSHTDATGRYHFAGLGTGDYDVYLIVGDEWNITTPSMYTVRVNGITTGADFGMNKNPGCKAKPDREKKVYHKGHDRKVVRMPSTGIADLPSSGLLGAIVLALGLVAGLGFVMERRQRP